MRSKNSLKNAKVNLVFNLITTLLGFVSRSIFIFYLGGNILGFNTLIVGIIGVLNVTELGIGIAVNYELYKPLVDKNYEKISEIMIIFKRLYMMIGTGIFLIGLCVIPFLNNLTKGELPYYQAIIYYLILLVTTAGTYFFSYKQTLINADQRGYLIQNVLGVSNVLRSIVQIIALAIFHSYESWLIISLIFTLGGNIYASKKVDSLYGGTVKFRSSEKTMVIMKRNNSLTKNIMNIFFHKLGEIVIFQTAPLIIAAFANLMQIGIYANYTLITNALNTILYSVFNGITASVGNLIASESREKTFEVFKEMRFMVNTLGIVICFSLYMVINRFITIWVGPQYLFDKWIVLAIIVNFYIQVTRSTITTFKNSYGIYWDIWAPLIEVILNLSLAIFLASKYGIIGIFIGTLISNMAIVIVWQPYTVYKYGFKINTLRYYGWFIGNIILYGCISAFLYFIINKIDSIIFKSVGIVDFLFTGFVSVIFMSLIIGMINFRNKSFRKLLIRLKSVLIRR